MTSRAKIVVPPVLKFGNIVYSENFGRGKVGIIISAGFTADNKTYKATVCFFNKKNEFMKSNGPLETLEANIGSPLINIGSKIDDPMFKATQRRKSISEEIADDDYFKDILDHTQSVPEIAEQVKKIISAKEATRIRPSRRSAAEMLAHRYSSSSDEEDEFNIVHFREAEGRRSRRRKSRHYKKTNHLRRKSNRRKSQRNKK